MKPRKTHDAGTPCKSAYRARILHKLSIRGLEELRTVRVFPVRTNATPLDALAVSPRPHRPYTEAAPGMFPWDVDAVHISAAFEWDLPACEWLARQWEHVAPVRIGGPATGMRGEEFTPGMYIKPGYVITSRGCPNRCWHCSVWRREGQMVRELPIMDGWNVLDDNLLACSRQHIESVFEMVKRQKRKPEFTGGLEAARFQPWMAEALRSLSPNRMYFAYDTPDDWEPLRAAADMCWTAGFKPTAHRVSAYVLCGWPKDTMSAADERMRRVLSLGIIPMAMLWRDKTGKTDPEWRRFARTWIKPQIIGTKLREVA